jgi:hypothetical protein
LATVTIKKTPFRFFKQDHTGLGLFLGFLAPVLGFTVCYFIKMYPMFSFREFISLVLAQRNLLTSMTSLSLLANAVLFTLYVNSGKDNTAKGIFLTTCLYGIAALLLKVIL